MSDKSNQQIDKKHEFKFPTGSYFDPPHNFTTTLQLCEVMRNGWMCSRTAEHHLCATCGKPWSDVGHVR